MPGTPLVQMMFARRFIAAGLAVAAASVAACQPNDRAVPPPQSEQAAALDTAAVRAAIDSLRSDYEQAVASGNFDKMATGLAEGAVMVPPGGPKWDAMFASSKLPFPPGATIDITPIEIRVLSPDWAYEFGTSTLTYKPAGAATAETMNDTYLVLFRKTAGGWKLFREVASSNLPPQTTPRR
jgi:ketosteroid isomerase-like protein